jgi:PAS domain S-box-containing protein
MRSSPERAGAAETTAGAGEGVPVDHFAAIVASSYDAVITKDRNGTITSWNPAAERMYGYTREEAVGQPISILIPEHRAGEELQILDKVFAGEAVDHYETERVTKDGRPIVVSLTVSPIHDASGAVVSASVIARDITDRHRARVLASRLQALTVALAREITPDRAVEVLLEHAVVGLGADAGAVGLVDAEGEHIELVGSSGYSSEGLSGWERFPVAADLPMSVAVRSGEPVWTSTQEELATRFPVLAGAIQRFSSLAVIPLGVERAPFGALSLSFLASRRFDPEDQAFLMAAAQQAAGAIERARIYETERELGERLAFLAEASELLAGTLDPDAALQALADLAVPRIADWCGVDLVDDEGNLRNVAVAHVDPARVELAAELRERYPADPHAETGVPNVIRTGRSEIYPEISEELLAASAHDDEHLRLIKELGLASAMIIPLRARHRILGAVSFVAAESGHRFGRADLELAEDLARRAALSIDNSILYRREHEAAVTLQRSLLPETLPTVEGVQFAARYEPAAPGLEVGGDWYEVVSRPDGTIAVMIGDVAGRGIRAASIMGRVRPALRAYALDGHGPRDAIERLDGLIRESERPEMTTVFHLHYDPNAGRAEYVRAGHPPALLRLADGTVNSLDGAGTPPLGILEGVAYRSHGVDLPPGSLLLLYTDGLIERRGETVEAGLERLKRAFAAAPQDAEACLAHLAEAFSTDAVPDDVAMLAMATASANGR